MSHKNTPIKRGSAKRKLKKVKTYLPEGGSAKLNVVVHPRARFLKYWDFLFSCCGAVIGFGNVWVFPALAANHGGVYFVLVSLVIAIFVSIPMCCIEMFVGQLSGFGIVKTLRLMSPLFRGVGWAIMFLNIFQILQYGLYISYSIFYFFMSFKRTLWWTLCGKQWNSQNCLPLRCFHMCINSTKQHDNSSDCMEFYPNNCTSPISSTEEFFYNFILKTGPGADDDNYAVSWQMCVSLLLCYSLIFGCLMFGLRISSKVAYVTVWFPYVGFLIIFWGCLTQDGAANGLRSFFTPDSKDFSLTWTQAISHVIWSSNVGTGIITLMTSYNPFHNDCKRDATIVVLLDLFTSVLATLCVFAGSGIIAKDLGKTNVYFLKKYGRNLAFIVYPEILSRMPAAPFWASLFYLILIAIGMDTIIWVVEPFITEISDVYHSYRSGWRRVLLVFVFCAGFYLISLLFCVKETGALYFATLSHLLSGYCIVLFAFLEVAAVLYIYGYHRFANDVSFIVGSPPSMLWKFGFLYTAPITLLILLIRKVEYTHAPPLLFHQERLPYEYSFISESVKALTMSFVFIFPVYLIVKTLVKKKRSLVALLAPSKHWCTRKKADLEVQHIEIEAAEKGIMGTFEMTLPEIVKINNNTKK